jgi:hypothetical protein
MHRTQDSAVAPPLLAHSSLPGGRHEPRYREDFIYFLFFFFFFFFFCLQVCVVDPVCWVPSV